MGCVVAVVLDGIPAGLVARVSAAVLAAMAAGLLVRVAAAGNPIFASEAVFQPLRISLHCRRVIIPFGRGVPAQVPFWKVLNIPAQLRALHLACLAY